MNAFDLTLYHWLAGGDAPPAFLLKCAIACATWGASAAFLAIVYLFFRQPADRLYLLAALLMAVCAGMLAHRLADKIGLPRPFVLGLSPAYIPHGNRGSLPSAHASVIFTLACIFAWRPALRRGAIVMALVGLLTSWGRIYTGLHFPLDILAGAALALWLGLVFGAMDKVRRARCTARRAAASAPPLRNLPG